MTTYFLLHKYRLNHLLIRCLSNHPEWVYSSRHDLYWRELSQNLCDSKLQNFCAQLFQLQNYFVLRILKCFVAYKVLIFTFCCAMPRRTPVGDIRRPSDGFKDIVVSRNGSIWEYGSDWSLWVHPSAVINIPPGFYALNISNNLQPTEGEVFPITVYLSLCLVGVDDIWLNSRVVMTRSVSLEGCAIPTKIFQTLQFRSAMRPKLVVL